MKLILKDLQNGSMSEITITDRNYITEGGEGKIYGKQNLIYKIYIDQKKTIPEGKIEELSILDNDMIVRPIHSIYNKISNQRIGFTMNWIKDTVPLCKMFTNDFWKNNNIDNNIITKVLLNIEKGINFIHNKKCLMVDGNEMNYLVNGLNFEIPYFIDVDSYKTPSYPATAFTPSIKDYHSKCFNEQTDWFSFGILATQLMIGIHPYKGSHPKFKRSDLVGRMKTNVSIFNKDVSIPSATRDLRNIPVDFKEWLVDMFEKGKRIPPPGIIKATKIFVKEIVKTISIIFDLVLDRKSENEDIIGYENNFLITKNKFLTKKTEYNRSIDEIIVYTNKDNPVFISIKDKYLNITKPGHTPVKTNIQCYIKTVINDKLVVLNEDKLMEISLNEYDNITPIVKTFWSVMPNSTKLYKGIVCQNVLGVKYFIIPFQGSGSLTPCIIKAIPELREHRIISAKHECGIVNVITLNTNTSAYDSLIFNFNNDYTSYEYIREEDVNIHEPNFTVLDNGTFVRINTNDTVEIRNVSLGLNKVKLLSDKAVTFDMKLYKKNSIVYISKGKELYKMSIKK